jgi:hypothetical protein
VEDLLTSAALARLTKAANTIRMTRFFMMMMMKIMIDGGRAGGDVEVMVV